jgi:hypothetical protein
LEAEAAQGSVLALLSGIHLFPVLKIGKDHVILDVGMGMLSQDRELMEIHQRVQSELKYEGKGAIIRLK